MSVYCPKGCRTWRYSFYFKGTRYTGSTGASTQKAAREFETAEKKRVRDAHEAAQRRRAAGVEIVPPEASPLITDWAGFYMEHVKQLMRDGLITRPERIEDLLRVLLRFWGAKPSGTNPKNPVIEGEPYHDLRLIDPIRDPDWIERFEQWMRARGVAGQTKNQYRSTMRQMYQHAMQPAWRKKTGVQVNPFDGIYRDRPGEREVTMTPDELRRVLQHASYHVRLACAIGGLAPKLRLANILALEWGVHLDPDLRFITVRRHKTATKTRRPLVIPIIGQLRTILLDARRRNPDSAFVVSYRGQPITRSIRGGLKAAATAAGVPYGRFVENGVTFHVLRHTAATILAELDVAEAKRKSVMGHRHLGTTQKYTHLRPLHEIEPLERLSETLPVADLVTMPWRRASRRPLSKTVRLVNREPREVVENTRSASTQTTRPKSA